MSRRYETGAAKLPLAEPLSEKFFLLSDFGIITVPENFAPGITLSLLKRLKHLWFYDFDYRIKDKNFKSPELTPGVRLHVRAWKQMRVEETTSEECLAFLLELDSMLLGPYGLSLLFEQKRTRFIQGYKYLSFDKRERLPRIGGNDHGVPVMKARVEPRESFSFLLGTYEGFWREDCLLVSFNEI